MKIEDIDFSSEPINVQIAFKNYLKPKSISYEEIAILEPYFLKANNFIVGKSYNMDYKYRKFMFNVNMTKCYCTPTPSQREFKIIKCEDIFECKIDKPTIQCKGNLGFLYGFIASGILSAVGKQLIEHFAEGLPDMVIFVPSGLVLGVVFKLLLMAEKNKINIDLYNENGEVFDTIAILSTYLKYGNKYNWQCEQTAKYMVKDIDNICSGSVEFDEIQDEVYTEEFNKIKCPHCGAYIKEGENSCSYCGHKVEKILEFMEKKENPKETSNDDGELILCKNCGKEILKGSAFCKYCGEEQIPKIMFCRKCGKKIKEDSSYCNNCGTKLR